MYTARRSRKMAESNGSTQEFDGEEKKCSPAKCKSCCKSFTAFLFSTLGLVIMVVAYSIAGGFLFRMIEEDNERKAIREGRRVADIATDEVIERVWNITSDLNVLHEANWTAVVATTFENYRKQLYRATTRDNWDGAASHDSINTEWTFAGALLYAVTAITTIGYGHVTPKTTLGMLATILYCVFGIPLTLMCIANVGKFFARVFRIMYHTLFCGICCICCLEWRQKRLKKKLEEEGGGDEALEMLGNGNTITISNDPDSNVKPGGINLSKAQVWLLNVKNKFSHSMRDDVTVPIYLCLVVMSGYIFVGAIMFSVWEEWHPITGAYFCFVTLTTIGFGDFVPGVTSDRLSGKTGTERLVFTALYVFIGLALVGMCIDLMQADVIKKVMWLAEKIGVKRAETDKARSLSKKGSMKQTEEENEFNRFNNEDCENLYSKSWDSDNKIIIASGDNDVEPPKMKSGEKHKDKRRKLTNEVKYCEESDGTDNTNANVSKKSKRRLVNARSPEPQQNFFSENSCKTPIAAASSASTSPSYSPTEKVSALPPSYKEFTDSKGVRNTEVEMNPTQINNADISSDISNERMKQVHRETSLGDDRITRSRSINGTSQGLPKEKPENQISVSPLLYVDVNEAEHINGIETLSDMTSGLSQAEDDSSECPSSYEQECEVANTNNNNSYNRYDPCTDWHKPPLNHHSFAELASPNTSTYNMRPSKSVGFISEEPPAYDHLRKEKSENAIANQLSLTGAPLLDMILEDPIYLHQQIKIEKLQRYSTTEKNRAQLKSPGTLMVSQKSFGSGTTTNI